MHPDHIETWRACHLPYIPIYVLRKYLVVSNVRFCYSPSFTDTLVTAVPDPLFVNGHALVLAILVTPAKELQDFTVTEAASYEVDASRRMAAFADTRVHSATELPLLPKRYPKGFDQGQDVGIHGDSLI